MVLRRQVHGRFEREGWSPAQAVLLFIVGTRGGDGLRDTVDSGGVAAYARATTVRVFCRDQGDQVPPIRVANPSRPSAAVTPTSPAPRHAQAPTSPAPPLLMYGPKKLYKYQAPTSPAPPLKL